MPAYRAWRGDEALPPPLRAPPGTWAAPGGIGRPRDGDRPGDLGLGPSKERPGRRCDRYQVADRLNCQWPPARSVGSMAGPVGCTMIRYLDLQRRRSRPSRNLIGYGPPGLRGPLRRL